MYLDLCKNVCGAFFLVFFLRVSSACEWMTSLTSMFWKVRHRGDSLQTKADEDTVMLCVRAFEGSFVVGACELITCAVPDDDYATRNGSEVILTND